jgi:hypothetical protein
MGAVDIYLCVDVGDALMNLIIYSLEDVVGKSSRFVELARSMLLDLVIPSRISRSVVEKFYRKALRTGVWRKLRVEQRALILALRRWRGWVRSRVLLEIVRNIFLEIELSTFRGKALLYGVAITIKNRLAKAIDIVRDIGYILATGIMYLNNPPMLRVYG